MAKLEAIASRVKTYLMDIGYDKWSRAYSKANRTMTMTSNIAESVNAANKHARDLPVVNLFDFMKTLIQKWNYTNRKDAVESFMKIGAKYEKILADNTILSQTMTVLPSTEFLHLVIDGQTRNVVRLHEKNCTCGRFQLDDIPCPHAMAVIQKFHMDSYKYCSDYYSIDYLLKTYEVPVNPLPDETTWQIPEHVSSQVLMSVLKYNKLEAIYMQLLYIISELTMLLLLQIAVVVGTNSAAVTAMFYTNGLTSSADKILSPKGTPNKPTTLWKKSKKSLIKQTEDTFRH
ncbi:PREDICTED: uncharacterized protein LOC109231669 [Nicotiana attenuata]|uniref:uncharacterized protein LOC109231669 n=1 Tax=Nicotiana attenuata TaxID=49451 RepID=UPI000904CCF3|nr:PREDICTED: uncharacterized protein LOC109231669 [Nicotiana attenuata]